MPGVRRILCNNPGPFTFKGTVSYIVGRGHVAIIDPGPVDEAHMRGAARRGARRDRDAHHRHPYPSRPFARRGAHQGRDRRADLRRRSAPRRAAAPHRRSAAARIRRRQRLPSRHHSARWRRRRRRRLDAGGDRDARPHRQSHGVRAEGDERAVLGRPRDGLVDAGGGAARRRHERLHGVAGKARRAARRRPISPAMAARCGTRRVSCSITSGTVAPASSRSCTGSARARADIPTLVRAIYIGLDPRLIKAAGLSVFAHLEDLVTRGLVVDRRRAIDRGPLPLGRRLTGLRPGPFASSAPALPAGPASARRSRRRCRPSSARTRAALVPKSNEP